MQFIKLYDLPIKSHVSETIRKWIVQEKIPPFLADINSKEEINKDFIHKMVEKIDKLTNPEEKIKNFRYIINECIKRISKLN